MFQNVTWDSSVSGYYPVIRFYLEQTQQKCFGDFGITLAQLLILQFYNFNI